MDNETTSHSLSNDPEESMRIENEILKLKMLAQFGEGMKLKIIHPVPPEVENRFLKNIMAFDIAGEKRRYVKLYDLLGRPSFKAAKDLTGAEISDELAYMMKLMSDKQIVLHLLGEYDHLTIYSFITEELFAHETLLDDGLAPGMVRHFIYEDFHPNHTYDIDNCAREFLTDWFEQKFGEYSWELSDTFVLKDSTILSRVEVLSKLKNVLASYTDFKEQKFIINDISYQLNEENDTGLGHAEGFVKYKAVLENNEVLQIEGNFKLYMSQHLGWWKIFYFIFPGFEWN